ncbi:MAG: tRNA (guanosine-2'-O-)-methyltransferase [Sphingobacteriales bacterium]|jgi:tRNA (guanosine-2'-O-)-methyltransferase
MKSSGEIIQYLEQFVSENKQDKISEVLSQRTRYIAVVLENIFQPHNASAVLRSCDCFGIQNLHVIENENEYSPNQGVTIGANKWIDIIHYNEKENNTVEALRKLKAEGYRLIATTPHKDDVTLDELDISKGKFALVFGTEKDGLTELALEECDEFVKIPMVGFSESFNISVSAAICLHHVTTKLRETGLNWELTEKEKEMIKLDWYSKVIRNSELIIEEFTKQ